MAERSDMKAIEAWMRSFGWEPEHSLQVRVLALQLFDQLKPLHGLTRGDRQMLEAAAIVHDIGFSIDELGHHKHSFRLIRKGRLPGFSPAQQEIIAHVARYHRKAHPQLSHKSFAKLSPQDRERVRKLSAMLRLTDGLDRSHLSTVRKLCCDLSQDGVVVEVHGVGEVGFDIWGAERKRALFEEVFGLKVRFAYPEAGRAPGSPRREGSGVA